MTCAMAGSEYKYRVIELFSTCLKSPLQTAQYAHAPAT